MPITKIAEEYLAKEAFTVPKALRTSTVGIGKDLANPISLGFGALSVAGGTGTVGGEVAGQVAGYTGSNLAGNLSQQLTKNIKLPGKLGFLANGIRAGLNFIGKTGGGIAGYTAGDTLGTKFAPLWKRTSPTSNTLSTSR